MFLALLLTLLNLSNLDTSASGEKKVIVAAAANTQFVIKALVNAFEAQSDIEVELILGSSGKLAAQISNGAPYDIFLSANMKYPLFLKKKGMTSAEPMVYAQGVAVIWTMKDISLQGLESLTDASIKKLAIANPRTAPYGTLADSVLRGENLYEKIQDKLVFGSSISQVNQYVVLKVVDAGITSKSVVVSPEMAGKGRWVEIPDATIDQGMVLLKQGMTNNRESTESFYSFLQSEEAKSLFLKYGYLLDLK